MTGISGGMPGDKIARKVLSRKIKTTFWPRGVTEPVYCGQVTGQLLVGYMPAGNEQAVHYNQKVWNFRQLRLPKASVVLKRRGRAPTTSERSLGVRGPLGPLKTSRSPPKRARILVRSRASLSPLLSYIKIYISSADKTADIQG